MLASPKTPDGPGGLFVGSTPGVIGAQEVYRYKTALIILKQNMFENSSLNSSLISFF